MNQLRKPFEFSLRNDGLEKTDLRTLLYPLWLNKWFIALVTSICLVFGIIHASQKIPLYSSNILLQFEQPNNLMTIDKFLPASSLLSGSATSIAEINTALIKSRYILEPVIRQLNLDLTVAPEHYPIFGAWYARRHAQTLHKPWWGSSRYAWGGEKITIDQFSVPESEDKKGFVIVAAPNHRYALYDSQNNLILKGEVGVEAKAVVPGKGLFILQVKELNARANTRFNLSKVLTHKLIEQLSRQLQIADLSQEMQLRNDTGILKISLIGADPDLVVKILNSVAKITSEKNAEKKLKEASKTLAFMKQQLPQIKKSLDQAETTLNNYLAKEGLMDLTSESKLILTEISDAVKSLNNIKINRAAALQKYTAAHPYIITLNEREKALRLHLDELQKQVSQLPARDQMVVSLMRDVRVKSQLYLAILNKIQSLQVVKGGAVSDVSIIGLAAKPDAPLPAGRIISVLFSFLIGLVLSSAFIYLR